MYFSLTQLFNTEKYGMTLLVIQTVTSDLFDNSRLIAYTFDAYT